MSSKTHIAVGIVSEGKLGLFNSQTRIPGPGEVLIQVEYAAVSAADAHAVYQGFYVNQYPQIIGLGAAGPVVAAGPDVEDLHVGDMVGCPERDIMLSSQQEIGQCVLSTRE
jgi:NADPH:quinone reductase-like Zn-dependent oxidoreductase